jgi:hypothetical protein
VYRLARREKTYAMTGGHLDHLEIVDESEKASALGLHLPGLLMAELCIFRNMGVSSGMRLVRVSIA